MVIRGLSQDIQPEEPQGSWDEGLAQELQAIEAESIGWQPLDASAYLHQGASEDDATVLTVVGIPDAAMAGMNVLLLL